MKAIDVKYLTPTYSKDGEILSAQGIVITVADNGSGACLKIEGGHSMNWRTDEPPKDNKTILIDIDYPWPLIANWNQHEQKYVFANIQVNMMHGKYCDPYWESEYAHASEVKRWMPLPEM